MQEVSSGSGSGGERRAGPRASCPSFVTSFPCFPSPRQNTLLIKSTDFVLEESQSEVEGIADKICICCMNKYLSKATDHRQCSLQGSDLSLPP
jgi:hypothetical protein